MMSNRCRYALKAMLELALREGTGPVPISGIAAQHNIPSRFLEAILRNLKQAGLTDSARGKDGGYFLAKPARTIRVGTVVRLFEGPLVAEQDVPSDAKGAPDVFTDLWRQAEKALASVYDGVTFGELAERERMRQSGGLMNYAI